MTAPTRTTKSFEERANENKRLKKVTPVYGNFQQNFKKRATQRYKEDPEVRELYAGKRWFEDESIPTPEDLLKKRPGFENDSTAKTIIRNLIQFPKEFYTRWAPAIQVWSYLETQQAKEEANEAVDDALRQGLIDEEKAALLKQNIGRADEYTVLNKPAIEKKLEETTGIPLQSSSRFGDLIGLAGRAAGFARGSAGERLTRGLLGAKFSREIEENFPVSQGTSDFIGGLFSQTPTSLIQAGSTPNPLALALEDSRPPASGSPPPPPSPARPSIGSSSSSQGSTRSWRDAIPPEIRDPEFGEYTSMTPYQTGELIRQNIPEPTPPPRPPIFLPENIRFAEVAPPAQPSPANIQPVPELPAEPMTKQELQLQREVGEIVSPSKFSNTTTAGKQLSTYFTKQSNEAYKNVNELYDASKAVNKGIETIRPQLARDLERVYNQLTEAPVPAAIERDLLQTIRSIQGAIGNETTGYKPISNQALIDQIQSVNRKNQSELILGNAKNIYRVINNALDRELERSAKDFPQALQALKKAREARRKWGELYDNDTVYGLKDPSNRSPSKTYNALLTPDNIKIMEDAIGKTKQGMQFINRLKRDYTEKVMAPFSKGKGTDTIEYKNAIRELEPVIGKEKTAAIDKIYKQQTKIKTRYQKKKASVTEKRSKIEAKNKAEIARAKQEQDLYKKEISLIEENKKSFPQHVRQAQKLTEDAEKLYQSQLKELQKQKPYSGMTNEQIYNSANTITGLKELEKALSKNPDLYKRIARQKAYDLLSNNAYGRVALKQKDAAEKAIRTSAEREFLNYTLGEKNVKNLEIILDNTDRILELVTSDKAPSFPVINAFQLVSSLTKGAYKYTIGLGKRAKANYLRNVQGVKTIQNLPELLENEKLLQEAADAVSKVK